MRHVLAGLAVALMVAASGAAAFADDNTIDRHYPVPQTMTVPEPAAAPAATAAGPGMTWQDLHPFLEMRIQNMGQ